MTFDRVLVPLDGSRLAEASLPVAEALARNLGSALVLFHAVEPEAPAAVHGEPHLSSAASAQAYLDVQRERYLAEGLTVDAHVVEGGESDVAPVIAHAATGLQTGTIAMAAHGRRTLRGLLAGPVAQRILQVGDAAVLMRTVGADAGTPFRLAHIVLPIDFRHDLDAAIDATRILARGFGASVTLLHSVYAAGSLQARLLPGASAIVRAQHREEALERLAQLAASLRADGIETEVVLGRQSPDSAITEAARDGRTDLVVLVTHARAGLTAWYEGSVAQQLVAERDLTLLLLRGR